MNIPIEQLKFLNKSSFIVNDFKRKQTRAKLFIFVKKKLNIADTNYIFINNRRIDNYFDKNQLNLIIGSLVLAKLHKQYVITILIFVKGGGIINQRKVITNLIEYLTLQKNKNSPLDFKFYKRNIKQKDYRKKERKKYGLKKARKASQYHKR